MNTLDTETLASLFLLPENIAVEAVYPTSSCLTLQISCTRPSACCPECGTTSERVHARYRRTVADVPCGGRLVTLALTVRKFVCHMPDCPRHIFTERLPDLVQSYARMTNRLREVFQALGFATCGELLERLAPKLGMSTSGPTLLRHLRAVSIPPPKSVRVVGIDDWAWKKGQTYGTLLVDLETRCPIELLADRKEETVEAWLRLHPEIEVVSRDRAGAYAQAARKGAPQAQEVADRFHLLKNLREHLRDFLLRKQDILPEEEKPASDDAPLKARGKPKEVSPSSALSPTNQQEPHFRNMSAQVRQSPERARNDTQLNLAQERQQASRARRHVRYEAVRELHQQGFSGREIARRLKISRTKVQQFIHAEQFPEHAAQPQQAKSSILDPYKPYILERWAQGCHNGAQLYHEIKLQGFPGSEALVRFFVTALRKHLQAQYLSLSPSATATGTLPSTVASPKPFPQLRISPTRASWLFVSQPDHLNGQEQVLIEKMCKILPDLKTTYHLAQAFVSQLANRQESELDNWLSQAEQSGIAELKSFAQGIRRDYQAVRSTFTSPWSNGQVEGQVGRLKLHKRQMYGRANFDLLRLRVLHRD